jgi:hypothetical protein
LVIQLNSRLCHPLKKTRKNLEWNLHPSHDSSIETQFRLSFFYLSGCLFSSVWLVAAVLLIGLRQQSVTPTRKSTAPVEVETNLIIGRLS